MFNTYNVIVTCKNMLDSETTKKLQKIRTCTFSLVKVRVAISPATNAYSTSSVFYLFKMLSLTLGYKNWLSQLSHQL